LIKEALISAYWQLRVSKSGRSVFCIALLGSYWTVVSRVRVRCTKLLTKTFPNPSPQVRPLVP